MPIGQVEIKLRPIKLAFLVDPTETDAVLHAIEINTLLWGGMFNPIIPVFRRRPKNWVPFLPSRTTAAEIVSGYVNAYNPDFMVPLGKCANNAAVIPLRELISVDDIISPIKDEGVPGYGIGIFELLNYIYDQDFKFIQKNPIQMAIAISSNKHHLFTASVFGAIPSYIDAAVKDHYKELFSIEWLDIKNSNYLGFLISKYIFPSHISQWKLRTHRGSLYRDGYCIFYMDASNTLDVIDYWNLRAVGWTVIPIIRQVTSDEHVKEVVVKFIERNYTPHRYNQQIYHNTTILRSRSIIDDEVLAFAQSLNVAAPTDQLSPKYVIQQWYPRIWDNWAREKDGVDCCEIEADAQTHEFQEIPKRLSFLTLDPPMLFRYRGAGTPRFANTIKLRFYGDDAEPMAEIIPEGDDRVAHAIGAIGWKEWRIGPQELVYLSRYPENRISFNPPRAEQVFSSWLKAKGWEVSLSSPGRIAKQVLKQIDGVWRLSGLANPGLISLLVKKLTEGRTLSKEELRAEAHKIAQQDKDIFQPSPQGVILYLTDLNIVRLGMNIQCPVCQQRSWHSMDALDYQIRCEKCLHVFTIPSHSPDELKWAYRAFGPFSLPNSAYGVYSVLLTLRFFVSVLEGATTPIMSFLAKGHGHEIEADLGLFFQKMVFGREKRELLFAECKTYSRFTKRDVGRMRQLAQSFPGAIIVFSTLNETLNESEKRFIRPLANQGRRHWRDDRSYNPVLILTATELFSHFGGLGHAWEAKGGKHAALTQNRFDLHDILPLCDLTQQLYLAMPSWHQWLEERRQLRVRRLQHVRG
jgi:hypothetical protein